MPSRLVLQILAAGAIALGTTVAAHAEQTNVAVAANFTDAANEIAQAFEDKTGHEAILSFGSTGQLYTQITQDAPFEVFLAADDERPGKAIDEGLAAAGSQFTYAIGKIVLWSKDADLVHGEGTLTNGDFTRIAIANPATAPYGAAAVQAMQAIGVYDRLEPKIVQGNNIAQTYQFVETGNAELGFIALSQVVRMSDGSRWEVPAGLYQPIRQDAVLLEKGAGSEAAKAFVAFLQGPEAASIIARYGYGTGASS
jgi:molybdate transport system substrate-binding protein